MSLNNSFPRYSVDDLRFLLKHIDSSGLDLGQLKTELGTYSDQIYAEELPTIYWADSYEDSFLGYIVNFVTQMGMTEDIKNIVHSKNIPLDLITITDAAVDRLDKKDANLDQKQSIELGFKMMSLGAPMVASIRSLLTYGYYMNDLVKIARESKDIKEADTALLNAIRIDPSVITCPTGANRLSQALLFGDKNFMNKLQNAITGKLGVRESKNYQKMRYILQVLHEAGANNLTDQELNDLFVKELEIYSDSQGTSQKNISEFTRKFRKQKSTI